MTANPAKVLVVDDDQAFAEVLKDMLIEQGYESVVETRHEKIMAVVAGDDFDVLLLDLMMNDESTMPLIPQITALCPNTKIVVLTGYASISSTVQALKLGAENYLAKPVGMRDILGVLQGEERAILKDPEPMSLHRVEWEHIQRVLTEHDGNISATARVLGLHRRTLQRKLDKKPR